MDRSHPWFLWDLCNKDLYHPWLLSHLSDLVLLWGPMVRPDLSVLVRPGDPVHPVDPCHLVGLAVPVAPAAPQALAVPEDLLDPLDLEWWWDKGVDIN